MSTDTPNSEGDEQEEDQFGVHSVEDRVAETYYPTLDFEENWGDPVENPHTDLDEVPSHAVIDFGNGETHDCSMPFIIKRAMLDEEATVLPDEPE